MKSLVSSSDENASDQESTMDKYAIYSKDNKVYELKNSGYMKKKIISAIKKSLKTNNNKHSLTLNDVSVSEEKEIGNGCRQSLNIRIALDDKLYYSSGDAGVGPINIETFKLNDSTPTTKCCSHCSGGKEVKTEDDWPAYFACVKCDRKEKRKWYHENCKEKCCTTTSIYCDNCLRFKLTSIDHNFEVLDNKFAKYMYVVTCPNGGGISLHMDYERIMHFTEDEQKVIAKEFLKEAFKEDKRGFAQFTIAIVHNGASYMPDLLKLLAELHPTLPVKTTKLKCNTETEVMDLGTYYTKVKETYSNGTFAFNPLNEIQAASVKNDECGAYLPELLSLLERSAFLTQVLPWSDMTTKRFKSPHESDDGPIFWCRPGEQIVSLDRNSKRNRWNADEIETFLKERQQNLKYFCEKRYIVEELKKYRRSYSSREVLFEDRTRPHADQVWGNHFECTAAVGVIQAIHPDEIPEQNRACKEIVVFHAKHFEMLEALLHIDVTAAPKQQCAEWLDDAKLNMIRQMNIRYSKLHLYDNDIYFIPRKIVHQFKTISATLSVAWHTRLIEYYLEPDPPPGSEPAESSETAATSAAVKGEQLSDDDGDSSSSCSSDSFPPPTKAKKTAAATPKKKRKLSCSRSTASTDTEATPRKKKKPRSRSGTPQKRPVAEKTPKKRLQKTPKKVLILDEGDDEEKKPPEPAVAPAPPQKERSPSPEVQSQPPAPPPQPKESAPSSRSASPVAVAAVPKSAKKESRSRSPAQTKKRDSDDISNGESSKKKKSRSISPSPMKKRESDDISNVEPSKKKKHRSRSRSGSRKRSDATVVDKDRSKTEQSEAKTTNRKKKKDRSRSKSPKKSDKSNKKGDGSVSSSNSATKSDTSGTPSKSGKKSHSSSSKKHDDDNSKTTNSGGASETEKRRKKHRNDKDKRSRSDSHRSDTSPKRCERDKTPPVTSTEPLNPPSSPSTLKEAKDVSAGVESSPKSPPSSIGSLSTEKYISPSFASSLDSVSPSINVQAAITVAETEDQDSAAVVDDIVPTASSVASSPSTVVASETVETAPSPCPPTPELEMDESAVTDEASRWPIQPSSPSPPPPQVHIKEEPNSENCPVRVNHEIEIKPEPLDDVANPASAVVKDEPGALTAVTNKQKDTNTSTATKSAPEKLAKKSVTSIGGVDPTNRTGKDRKKEKLWDTPLFMPQDCDKYEWTKRSSATPIVSNRVTTKNGDKIVKQKTLNSLQQHNSKPDDKPNTANTSSVAAKSARSRSRSPPPWIKKKERKLEETSKPAPPPPPSEPKKSVDKRNTNAAAVADKEKSASSTSSSSDKHRDKEKKSSSEHKRSKEGSSGGKKDREKSEQRSTTSSEKSKKTSHTSSSSHTKDTGGKSTSSGNSTGSGKDHSHEKRKRSRSPAEKQQRDKHSSSSSSSSKKHKKHRSKSRDRGEPVVEKAKNNDESSTTQNIDAVATTTDETTNSTDTVSLKNPQDAELAANYKLMIPRVQIFDIGAKYKNGGMQNAVAEEESQTNCDDGDTIIAAGAGASTAEPASTATANADDQNTSSELSDESRLEIDETAATVESETDNQPE